MNQDTWVEKYRPIEFKDVILDENNKKIFTHILEKDYFPNLLFYGSGGVGKTTSIIALLHEYQKRYNGGGGAGKGYGVGCDNNQMLGKNNNIIHMNASDDRGIDVIRNIISQFVQNNNLFQSGLKFVILDEVDYMTKNAQQALKCLLQSHLPNARFCLICNYISKLDESLKNEFVCVRFNQLPQKEIHQFLKNIVVCEKLNISDSYIENIQQHYQYDIRSMINFIQLNFSNYLPPLMTDHIWDDFHSCVANRSYPSSMKIRFIHGMSVKYNTDKPRLIQNYILYLFRRFPEKMEPAFLFKMEELLCQNKETDIMAWLNYVMVELGRIF